MLLGLGVACLALAAACGGGSGGGEDGPGITDPARAVSATPRGGPPNAIYQIDSGRVSIVTGPTAAAGNTGSGGGRTHTVVEGDTCATIAGNFGITVDQLIRTNRQINADCSNLRIGDTLRAPTTTPTAAAGATGTPVRATATPKPGEGKTYTARAGDICGDIAESYGVTVGALIAANGLDPDCTNLKIGQVLRIP
jgi:LysM repeat protein